MKNVLERKTYIDGKPKPWYRGVIHGIFSAIFFVFSVGSFTCNVLDSSPWPCYGFSLLLFSKFFSYLASALLHLFPYITVAAATEALKFDLIAISVSIGFTVLPFTLTSEEAKASFTVSFLSILLQLICVQWQFRGHIGLDTPAHSSELPRNGLMVLQWLDTSYRVGKATSYSTSWCFACTTYIMSFALAGPVTASHHEEPVHFPWHKRGVWSLHEDFHLMLLAADFEMVAMAAKFVYST